MENYNYDHHVKTWEEQEQEKEIVLELIDTISKTQETYPEYRDFMALTAYISFTYGENLEETISNQPEEWELSPEDNVDISRMMGLTDEEILEEITEDIFMRAQFGEPDNSTTLYANITHEFNTLEYDPMLDLFVNSGWISNEKNWTSFELESSYDEKVGSLIFRFYNDEERVVTIMLSCGPYNNKHGQVEVSERATIGSQSAKSEMLGVEESPENKNYDDLSYRDKSDYAYERLVESGKLNAIWEGYGEFPQSLDDPEIIDVLTRFSQLLRISKIGDNRSPEEQK